MPSVALPNGIRCRLTEASLQGKMRITRENGKLYMLYASAHLVYNEGYFNVEGEKYYVFGELTGDNLYICKATFPKVQNLSLQISNGLIGEA